MSFLCISERTAREIPTENPGWGDRFIDYLLYMQYKLTIYY